MSVTHWEKDNVDVIGPFAEADWDRVETADGVRYVAKKDGLDMTVGFRPPRATQPHTGLKTGSTFEKNKDGSWSIKEVK